MKRVLREIGGATPRLSPYEPFGLRAEEGQRDSLRVQDSSWFGHNGNGRHQARKSSSELPCARAHCGTYEFIVLHMRRFN